MKAVGIRPDWFEVLRRAWHWTGTPPHVLREDCGLPELAMACDNDFETPRPPPGGEVVPDDYDVAWHQIRRQRATWAERLAEARAKG